jgi:hypothetical protein
MEEFEMKLPDPAKTRVTVGIPGYGHVPSLCLLSFGSFTAHGVARGYIHHIGTSIGAYIDRARNDIVRQALGNNSTHLIFIDQDMILPELALTRLLSHNKPCVGALYFGKDDLFTPVAFHLEDKEKDIPFSRVYDLADDEAVFKKAWMPDSTEGDPLKCVCEKPDDHLHKVGGTGMGCTLIQMGLFRKMKKFFGDEMWYSSKETGEDVHFAARCKEMGVDLYLDGFIQCGHIRDHIVTAQNYLWVKAEREQRDGK